MSTEIKHSERAHARLSASGSDRWMNCPASPTLEEAFPDETSVYAEEGTLAHEMGERMLKVDLKLMKMGDYRQQIEELRKHPLYHSDMEDPIMQYVTYVKEQFAEAKRLDPKAKILIEQKFSLEKYVKGGFGTGDTAVVFARQIEIIDLKFGAGKEVKAVHNSQLKYYGLGVLESLGKEADNIDMVKLTIVQPRMSNISSWSIPKKFLVKWGEDVLRPKAIEAAEGFGEAKAGDWCQFCKARAKCRALYDLGMEIAKQDFDIKMDPRLLNDEELFEAYQKADFIKKWLEDVKTTVLREAVEGKKWPGHKLVESSSNRQWRDETKVVEVLEENLYFPEQFLNTKLKGLGDLEKLLKKANFDKLLGPLTYKPPGQPTLVDEEDKREEYGKAQAEKDFAEPYEDYADFEEVDEDFDPLKF